MRSWTEHLDTVRAKPHHVRKQVALSAATLITALIAVVWLGVSLATGAFALKGSNFAQVTGAEPATDSTSGLDTSQVAGAAAAPAPADDTAPAHLQAVSSPDSMPQSPAPATGPTIIPF